MTTSSAGPLLSQIEELVLEERYREALADIGLLRKQKLDSYEHLQCGVLESRCYLGLGESNRGLETAQGVVEEGGRLKGAEITVIDALLEVANAALDLFEIDTHEEALDNAERMRTELPTDDPSLLDSIRARILYHMSGGLYYRDDVHKGIECAQESLSIRQRLGDLEGVVSSIMRIGYLHMEIDPNQTLEYHNTGLELNKERGRKRHILQALQCKGWILVGKGKWEEAEQSVLKSTRMAKEHGLGYWHRTGLYCLAYLHYKKGDFRGAERYYRECLLLSERVGAGLMVAMCSDCLGDIHRIRGELDEALRCYQRSMKINKEMDRIKGFVISLGSCGLIQFAKGHSTEAIRLLEEALAISKKRKESGLLMKYTEVGTLYTVMVLLDKGITERAQEHVEYLRRSVEQSGEEWHHQIYRTASALLLKSSPLPRSRISAKEYLAEVVDGRLIDFETTSMAFILLCDLLVEELKLSGERGALDELTRRLTQFVETSASQGSILLQTEAMILLARAALLDLDTEQADQLLTQAHVLARRKGLERLTDRVAREHKMLLGELSLWEELGDDMPTIGERAERIRIDEQIGQMMKQGSWRRMLF